MNNFEQNQQDTDGAAQPQRSISTNGKHTALIQDYLGLRLRLGNETERQVVEADDESWKKAKDILTKEGGNYDTLKSKLGPKEAP